LGFFRNVSHKEGTIATYPISNDSVEDIFIASGDLKNGQTYLFDVTIASRAERRIIMC